MSFNRNKSLAKAQKLLQKGKIDEAIREFEDVVRGDPSDVRTLLKIGDLHAKIGNTDAATSTYQKVGEHYASDGFFLKAVAVFKQILKIDPNLMLVYLKLAELYKNLGLTSDAIKQYQVVARHYESQGLVKDSLDVLQKISELEPDNIINKLKLAELYCREGHQEEGRRQFLAMAAQLESSKNYPELVRVYEKIVALDFQEEDAELKLVECYLNNSEPKKALIRLQKLFQKNPRNVKVLDRLAQCFVELSQPEKSKSVYLEIMSILDAEGKSGEKDQYIAKLRTLNIVGQDSQINTSEYSIHASTLSPREVKSSAKLTEEVETFLQYGLKEKAINALLEALRIEFEEAHYKKIMLIAAESDKESLRPFFDQLKSVVIGKGLHRYVPEIDACMGISTPSVASREEPVFEIAEDALSHEFERPQDLPTEHVVDLPSSTSDGDGSFSDFNLDLNEDAQILESVEFAVQSHAHDAQAESHEGTNTPEVSFEMVLDDPIPMNEPPIFNPEASISDGMTLEFSAIENESPPVLLDDFLVEDSAPSTPVILDPAPLKAQNVSEMMSEVRVCIAQGQKDRARDILINILIIDRSYKPALDALTEISAPVHSPVIEKVEVKPLQQPQSASDFFDLSLELHDEINQLESDFSQTRAAEEAFLSPEEVISEFKKGVAKTVSKDDYQTHYNLGIAYKEMGLLDEAIHEFEISRVDPELSMSSSSMIGHCLVGKREFAQAIALYKKTLSELPPTMSLEVLGLSYELGDALAGGGYFSEAYKVFSRVAEFDEGFRDAKIRAKDLKLSMEDKDDASKVASIEKSPKKNKVSYI